MDYSVFVLSFLVGGIICAVAQIVLDLTNITPARILVAFVCIGVFLGALGVYKPIFEAVGCGISVPLIGFGGTVAEGVKESIDTLGPMGILKGPFTAAAAGCSAALIFGYVFCLIFKGRPKRT